MHRYTFRIIDLGLIFKFNVLRVGYFSNHLQILQGYITGASLILTYPKAFEDKRALLDFHNEYVTSLGSNMVRFILDIS